jgi:hypothetical protein
MCTICDGQTHEEAHRDLIEKKERFGWALQAVEARRPWVYTIGLTERFGHPELVMAGVPIPVAFHALNAVGARIAVGERLVVGQPDMSVAETQVEVGAVHPVHLANGLVGRWKDHYDRMPGAAPPLEVLQLIPHATDRRLRLDKPHTNLKI